MNLSEGCDSAKIEIEDTGIGINPVEQTRVFERYHSAQTSGNGKVGMGLGLSLAKMLIELHGGHIWCRSAAIRGSVFGFSLPSGGAVE